MDIIEKLAELQDRFYKECGDLYEAIEVLGKPMYDEMLQNYFDTYKKLYKLLSEKYEIDIKNQEHVIRLEHSELTPHRCGFLWIHKNEARQLNEREVAATDRMQFDSRWSDLDELEQKIYATDDEPSEKLSLFKRLFKRRKQIHAAEELEAALQAADEAEPADVIEQPEPPAAVESEPETAAQATPENGSTSEPADVAQSSEPSSAAPGASDATHQSDSNAKNTGNVAQSPAHAQTSEKHKREPKRKKSAATVEPTSAPCTAPAPQLPGQICIENITGNKQ